MENSKSSKWEKYAPWIMAVLSFITMLVLGWFLIYNIQWFKGEAFAKQVDIDPLYKIHIFQMHLSMIKRSVGLFTGFAIMFAGASVALYHIKVQTNLSVQAPNLSFSLITASPSIVAIIVGAALIMFSISSKDTFPNYQSESKQNEIGTQIPFVEPDLQIKE